MILVIFLIVERQERLRIPPDTFLFPGETLDEVGEDGAFKEDSDGDSLLDFCILDAPEMVSGNYESQTDLLEKPSSAIISLRCSGMLKF